MTRSGAAIAAFPCVLLRTRDQTKLLSAVGAIVLGMLAASLSAAAQADSPEGRVADVLGPHNEGARGCMVCHASRSATVNSSDEREGTGTTFLWGNSGPSYDRHFLLADESRWVELQAGLPGGSQEVAGVLLCLSCHDGNLTPYNMMQSWSYERQVGLLGRTPFRDQKIASLLGREEGPMEDHPIGVNAPINPGGGLVFVNGKFSVIPKSPYAAFIANYGWPSLAPGKHSKAFGVTSSGKPYTLCTTCHDQHVRNVYVSGATSPIAGDATGRFYTTYFFVNGPYNPTENKLADNPTTSSTQFCRQCHFDLSNEGNNTLNTRTFF